MSKLKREQRRSTLDCELTQELSGTVGLGDQVRLTGVIKESELESWPSCKLYLSTLG